MSSLETDITAPSQGLREQAGEVVKPKVELDPNAPIALQAQNPFDLGKLRIGSASAEAAGIPAIWNTMLYGIGEMGPIRSLPRLFSRSIM